MDLRQRGVAHVNIFWALVPMVLFFGAAFYGYAKHTESEADKEALRSAEDALSAKAAVVAERDRQLTDLTAVCGNAGAFKALVGEGSIDKYTLPDKLVQFLKNFKDEMNIAASVEDLPGILGAARSELTGVREKLTAADRATADARNNATAAQASVATVTEQKDAEIARLEQEKRQEQQNLDNSTRDLNNQLADARDKTKMANESKRKVESDAAARTAAKNKEIATYRVRNQALADKIALVNPVSEPDGEVLSSSPSTGLAWIDLGTKDMLKTGTTFRVLEPIKGGFRLKGNAVVDRVEWARARISVKGLTNALSPVVRGDKVANALYSPALKRSIFLLGRFGTPYTKPELKRILENMGNTVHDRMGPEVDLVIVGRRGLGDDAPEISELPEFLDASKWDCEIKRLEDIRDLLKL